MQEGTYMEPANAIGSFGVRLVLDQDVPSDEWTKIKFDEVLWDTGGMYDLQRGAFVPQRDVRVARFIAGVRLVFGPAGERVTVEVALFRNGTREQELGNLAAGGTSPLQGLSGSCGWDMQALRARAGEVFEVRLRHDAGFPASLSIKDMMVPDEPDLWEPTATYFMGMYEVIP